ncbi:MAG: chaperone NapD [Candidatus Methanomethylicaceae archaeon]
MVLACILVHCKPGTATEVLKRIKEIKGVRRAFETLGGYDIVVEYEFPTLEKLGITVYEIAKIPGVVSTETLIETLL